jgi:hypothetical protein
VSFAYSLASADVWVDDVPKSLARMEVGFGLAGASRAEILNFPDFGVRWLFWPVDPKGVATTKLEVIGPDPSLTPNRTRPDYPFMLEFGVEQQGRPIRFHATVIKTLRLDDLVERLRRNAARFRLDPATEVIPRPRLFLGFNQSEGGRYDGGSDGGLRLEFWEPYVHERPTAASLAAARALPAPAYRIESRVMLVADAQQALAQLQKFIGWEPLRVWQTADANQAELGFDDPLSSTLQIISAVSGGELAAQFAKWGEGSWTVRFCDNDLRARQEALRAASMPCVERAATDGSGRRSLWVDLQASGEGIYEFVEPR